MVRRIFDLTLQGKTSLDILKTLNGEGIPSPKGRQWRKTTVHKLLTNEAYTGTLVWGQKARDGQDRCGWQMPSPPSCQRMSSTGPEG